MTTVFNFILITLLFASCSEQKKESHTAHEQTETEKYTCPMHPNVVQGKPEKCPVCGMNLVKVVKTDEATNDIMLNDSQIKLANITTQSATKKPIGQTVIINGRLAVDEQQAKVISSRAAGRIEKLFIKETGQPIQKGQQLYTLYSESLLTLQHEYLLAKEQYETLGKSENRYQSFLEGAEKKLLLYGLTKEQVGQLNHRNSLQPRVTFLAPASGVVTEINVAEGQSISEGSVLYKIEDITKLWVEADLYPNETSLVKTGDRINLSITDTDRMNAQVIFLSPEYRSNTQLVVMRAAIENPGMKFKPGQQVQVFLTHSSRQAIALPIDAVIRDEKGTHVYIQAGRNTFRPRMVKTGLENFDQVEITDGITEGDTVAISGAYLLYSELILKKGMDPMAGHVH
jgi:Cu(I)/Ag(I) efflux system membrane fusion protein